MKLETSNLSAPLARILRPQAAYRWLMPQIAAITPQYIEMILRGALAGNHLQAWELFDLMLDSWPELAAVSNELIEGVQRKKLIIEPWHEDDEQPTPEAVQKSKVASAALRRMRPDPAADENDCDGTIKDILSAWFFGQTVLEIDWQIVRAGQLADITAPRSTFWVHPVCYAWNMDGRLGLRTELGQLRNATAQAGQTNPGDRSVSPLWNTTTYQPRPNAVDDFPPDKFLIAIHKAKSGTALGGALLRPLAWWWCAANFSADWLLNLAQTFGLPFRWASYQNGTPQATIDSICSMLQNMGSAGWAAFPAGTTLELKEASKSGDSSPQGDLLDRADRYARTLVLGQTLSGNSGTGKGGGLAFGKQEGAVKDDRIDAAGKFACGVLNSQLIPSIIRLNYGADDECPVARFLEEEEGKLDDAQRDTTLSAGGLKIGVNFLRKKYGIPEPGKGEETIGGAAAAAETSNIQHPTSKDGQAPAQDDPAQARDSSAHSADATPFDEAALQTLVSAVALDLKRVNERFAAIQKINDPGIYADKLRAFLADIDQLKKDLLHDPASAEALHDIIASGLANGIARGANRP